jgi:hypothetical protein
VLHGQLSAYWSFDGDMKKLSYPPDPGDFNIKAVLDSPYFFS